jgi:hypothetical protein
MSYYTDLKQYDEILFMYKRTQSISRNKGEEVKSILNIYESESGNKVDRSCNVCVARALNRITKNYFQLKEQYANRRKGKND